MHPRRLRFVVWILFLSLTTIMAAGCAAETPTPTAETGAYLTDPLLREFYVSLGARDVLGPAITALFNYRSKQCQYVQNALLCFDPLAQGASRYSLYPLGTSFGLNDEPIRLAGQAELVVEGYPIYAEFEELYHRLYGPLYAGKPLTNPRYNATRNRVEQYFENVGFYRNLDDPSGEAHLLSYGVFACDSDCRYTPPQNAVVVPSIETIEQPFINQVVRLGGLAVFGMPLTDPYTADDGCLEQVYENVVLYAPADQATNLRLRPTAILLALPSEKPTSQVYAEANGIVFYKVEGDLGYHVPLVFDHFIAKHGGREISGNPISEIQSLGGNLFRQCFENYCLLYDNNQESEVSVRLDAIGIEYLHMTRGESSQPEAPAATLFTPESMALVVSTSHLRVASDQSQTINLFVAHSSDRTPLANVEATLTFLLPDNSQPEYPMPPTNAEGIASLTIEPFVPALPNGSVVSYQICLNVPADQPLCASESYLIWNYH